MNDNDFTDYSELLRDAGRGLERERERLEEKANEITNHFPEDVEAICEQVFCEASDAIRDHLATI